MSVPYVPMVVPPQMPSRQTQELAELVSRVISEYEQTHASITQAEIQEALALARQRSSGVQMRQATAVVVGLALALAAGVVAFVLGTGADIHAVLSWAELGVIGLLLVAIVVLVVRRKP